jgi:AmmeMemoRadiSam system protein A
MLTDDQKQALLRLARHTVEAVTRGDLPPPPDDLNGALRERCGVFVTLKRGGHLRGCIGLVEGIRPLVDGVVEMARASALEDPRFPPVGPHEVPDLQIEISVLSPLERVRDVGEIEVGTHGLVIRKGFYSGLLLPQVATEWGWDRLEFLQQTCLKAGLDRNAWREGAEIYRFAAEVFGE